MGGVLFLSAIFVRYLVGFLEGIFTNFVRSSNFGSLFGGFFFLGGRLIRGFNL